MAPGARDTAATYLRQVEFQALLDAEMGQAIRFVPTMVLEDKVTALVGAASYERSPLLRHRYNGSYTRELCHHGHKLEDEIKVWKKRSLAALHLLLRG